MVVLHGAVALNVLRRIIIEDASRFTAGPHSSAMVIRIRGRSIAEFVFDGFGKLVFLVACCVAEVPQKNIFLVHCLPGGVLHGKGARKTNIEIMMFIFWRRLDYDSCQKSNIGPEIIKIEVCWGLEGVLGVL